MHDNATSSLELASLNPSLPNLSGEFGNTASIHTFGQRARAGVETAREQVASLIGARPQEMMFTSGGTEADNQAIFGVVQVHADAVASKGSAVVHKHIITSAIEHEAVLNSCQALEKRGIDVTY